MKRFEIDEVEGKRIRFIGDNPDNKLISITWVRYPRFEIEFGGKHSDRENEIIEVAEYIGVKSWKAKGKRLSNYKIENVKEVEPVVKDEDQKPDSDDDDENGPKNDGDDIPFEVKRPGKDEDDKNQMSVVILTELALWNLKNRFGNLF